MQAVNIINPSRAYLCMLKSLAADFLGLPPNFIVLIVSENSENASLKILNYFLRKKDVSGIYVTIDKPSKTVRDNLIENKIGVEKLYFVDLISELSGVKLESEKTLFSCLPSNLTELSIILNSAMEHMKTTNKFIMFSSLSTMFSYNVPSLVVKFVHQLTVRMRNFGITGIFIITKNQIDEKTLSLFQTFSDNMVEI